MKRNDSFTRVVGLKKFANYSSYTSAFGVQVFRNFERSSSFVTGSGKILVLEGYQIKENYLIS